MDDSSMFLQWAMDQLHHHPSAAAAAGAPAYPNGGGGGAAGDQDAAFPSLQALRNATQPTRDLTVQVDHHRTNSGSWSSGDSPGDAASGWSPHTAACARTTGLGGGGNNSSRPVSWNFSAASAQPTDENNGGRGGDVALPPPDTVATAARASTGRRGGGGSAASSSPGPVQDHIIAERRRREKINQRFIELSTVIPGLKKMDKATILGDAVKYVRELQDKVKTLEKDGVNGGTIQSSVLVKKPCRMPNEEGVPVASGGGNGGGLHHQQLPEIEARLSDKSVLLRIHCDNARGLLVKLLSEVEKMSLSITHTNVMPFPASTAIITITTKMEEGFNTTVDEIVRRINSVLHEHYSSSA
ncbi:hypothetical protein QOZ80_5BG0447980 [Eleusine coracana subsp. coracana]|nr:hypothetical protein QOZ80_5BG0447980 [Eleusine coracana subsp. coracana]